MKKLFRGQILYISLDRPKKRRHSLISAAKQRIITDHGKSIEIEEQNRAVNEALQIIKSELEAEQAKHKANEELQNQLEMANAEIEKLRYGVDSIQELNQIKVR